jgi:acetyl-CoA carboxylase carboxyl transferase subunit alpha
VASQNGAWLDFERPLAEIEQRIEEMRGISDRGDSEFASELDRLQKQAEKIRSEIFSKLSRWQRVQLARHPLRPYTLDYVQRIMTGFSELHGDRAFADDPAVVAGLARFRGRSVMIVGHQKGRDTKENLHRCFGMPHPEGYRKGLRLMQTAGRFGVPVVAFIDTPGAYPGLGAEERGQFEAIARNLREMARLPVPVVAMVIGEGGSGGALAFGVADRLLMLENAIYSVITPEGCAAILWRDRAKAPDAAEALQPTSQDLDRLGIADEIIEEPPGGAHRAVDATAIRVADALERHLDELCVLDPAELRRRRTEKYASIGVFKDG